MEETVWRPARVTRLLGSTRMMESASLRHLDGRQASSVPERVRWRGLSEKLRRECLCFVQIDRRLAEIVRWSPLFTLDEMSGKKIIGDETMAQWCFWKCLGQCCVLSVLV